MILKASQRAGHDDLARHLMKPENEHVEIHDIQGFVADTVAGAFKEAYAVSRGTKCKQFLFSCLLNPPEDESVPVHVFEDAVHRIETRLGLEGQPRVLVFHEKEGRRHAHCVWSRINAESMTAINLAHTKRKLMDISRELYIEHGWKMPEGMIDPALRNPLNFDRKEWFQAKRTGQDPRSIKQLFQQCWASSDSGKAFKQALEQRGYFLARGDRRAVVAVDVHGEVYAVARWANVKTKDVVARMGDIAALPSLDDAQSRVAALKREKLQSFANSAKEDFAKASQAVEAKRIVMVERHRADRKALQTAQDDRWTQEAIERNARFRKGIRGLWDRVIGKHGKLRDQNAQEVANAAERDAKEKQVLIELQLEERQRLQREILAARRVHTYELTKIYRELSPTQKFGMAAKAEEAHQRFSQPHHLRL
ncbi:relaxase/mobilization nuclease domain-containing protein [Rhizobium sp. RU36D]|uniref:relaxase/mobilization nuclease domain-containing protein n=1 Tax=Rhizobium sp. RU36D TaxID=1907415 RepID=UPI0009D7DE6D|nr:relaxase/mobilization nuclease domain-containing protein [Rhizobium sp. RU36D]SMC78111.1 Relaxase/Mobilisation nuclease domain-containing protein [Rhizobium sp. RU36D]